MRKAQKTSSRTEFLNVIEMKKWQVSHQHVSLNYQTRRELLKQVAPRYHAASLAHKNLILNAFVEITGYACKSAILLLYHPPAGVHAVQRPLLPAYGLEVQLALFLSWKACTKLWYCICPPWWHAAGNMVTLDEVLSPRMWRFCDRKRD